MCTLSFVKLKHGYILTSNRDEDVRRASSPPRVQEHKGVSLLFPGDPLAKGSWIALREDGLSACLLNGAFEKHERKDAYKISRGTLLIDVLSHSEPFRFLHQTDMNGIEPFSMLICSSQGHAELFRWDENKLLQEEAVNNILLSSATLYAAEERNKRKMAFQHFLQTQDQPGPQSLFEFHQSSYTENKAFDFIMKRPPYLQTLSTTQILINQGIAPSMRYKDYLKSLDRVYHFGGSEA
jgi:uncharacterized protein with NRDE domain